MASKLTEELAAVLRTLYTGMERQTALVIAANLAPAIYDRIQAMHIAEHERFPEGHQFREHAIALSLVEAAGMLNTPPAQGEEGASLVSDVVIIDAVELQGEEGA